MKSLVSVTILLVVGFNVFNAEARGPNGCLDGLMFDSCIERRTCQSNNDPHMVSFTNYPFEFHTGGSHCLAYSNLYLVKAGFQDCQYNNAFCNCMIAISLPNGQSAGINNCQTGSMQIDTVQMSTGPVACATVNNPLFNPMTESHWNLVSSGNSNFKCVRYNSITYIKTLFPNPEDNVIVSISPNMDSVQVIVPPSYAPIKQCLCDVVPGIKVDNAVHIEQAEIEGFKNFENCENILKPEKLRDLIKQLDNADLNARLDNFVKNCAIDAELIRGIDIGKFQKDVARADICQVIVNQPVDRAAEFLKVLGLTISVDDLLRRIQLRSDNGFEDCVKLIQNF